MNNISDEIVRCIKFKAVEFHIKVDINSIKSRLKVDTKSFQQFVRTSKPSARLHEIIGNTTLPLRAPPFIYENLNEFFRM